MGGHRRQATGGVDLAACLRAATLAPSIHNSQPWQFRLRGATGVDVFADWRRQLDAIDPDGRQLVISVGAAVFNLRLAIHHCGHTATVRLGPSPGEPALLASVDVGGPGPPDPVLDELAAAMPHRHTNRLPFLPDAVPGRVLAELKAAAAAEGATLRTVPPSARAEVTRLVRAAEARLHDEGVYRAELPEWSRHRVVARPSAGWHAIETMPLRDFGLLTPRAGVVAHDTYPAILVLSTAGDTTVDRVRAGQALQRVWLTVTARRLAAAPMSQPLDIPVLRRLVSEHGAHGGPAQWAQVILLVGFAPPTTPTPRRDVGETLVEG